MSEQRWQTNSIIRATIATMVARFEVGMKKLKMAAFWSVVFTSLYFMLLTVQGQVLPPYAIILSLVLGFCGYWLVDLVFSHLKARGKIPDWF